MCKIRHHSPMGCKLIPDKVFYIKLVIVILLTLTFAVDIYNGFKPIASYIGFKLIFLIKFIKTINI